MANEPLLIWLDDERDPTQLRWQERFPVDSPAVVWLQSFEAFAAWIEDNGLPQAISFDHDLGHERKSGLDAAKHLVNYCLDQDAPLPIWAVHSANPVGSENIKALLGSFERHVH